MTATSDIDIVVRLVDNASHGLETIKNKTGGLGKAFDTVLKVTALAAAAGIGAAVVAGVSFLKMAGEEEIGIKRLAAAVDASGGSWAKSGKQIEAVIKRRQQLAFSDDDLRSSLALLTAMTEDSDEALRRQSVAMDFARGANIDLNTASKLLGKVTDENVNVLGRYGIRVKEGADATDVLALVQQKFAGQSQAFAESTAGKWAWFNIALDNVKETIGTALLPLASKLADKLASFLEEHEEQIGRVVETWMTFGEETVFPRIGKAIDELSQIVGRFIGIDLETVKGGMATWSAIIDKVGEIAVAAGKIIRDDLGAALNALTPIAVPVFNALRDLFDQIGLEGEGKGVDKAQALARAIEAIIGAIILGKIAALAGEVAGLVGNLIGVVSKTITITQKVVLTGAKLITGLVDIVQNITQKVTRITITPSARLDADSVGKETGEGLLRSLVNFITGHIDAWGAGAGVALVSWASATAAIIGATLAVAVLIGLGLGFTAAKIWGAISGETISIGTKFDAWGGTLGGRMVQFIVSGIKDAAVALPGAIAFAMGVTAAALTWGIVGLGYVAAQEILKTFVACGMWLKEAAIPGVITFFGETLPGAAAQFFPALPGMIKSLVFTELPKLASWIAEAAIPGIGTFFSSTLPLAAAAAVLSALFLFGSMGTWLWNAILGGLKSGLGAFAPIADFFSGLWDKFNAGYNWFKRKLGISSPSRLFSRIGAAIPQGLIEGIKGGVSQVEQSMHGLLPPEFAIAATSDQSRIGINGGAVAANLGAGATIIINVSGTWDLSNPNHIERLTNAVTIQLRRNLAMGA